VSYETCVVSYDNTEHQSKFSQWTCYSELYLIFWWAMTSI